MSAAKLFISYSHDSPEHQDRVLDLASRLRADGVDAYIDQYSPAPPEGWPIWTEKQIETADFVLVVCTETYARRAQGREKPGIGRGVLWEVRLIYNSLYLGETNVHKFIPVLFADCQPSSIPLALRALTYYQIDTGEGYDDLYRHLTDQPRQQVPALGERKFLRQQVPELGERKSLPTIAPQSYPASLGAKSAPKPTSLTDHRHRQQMIKQVRVDWIQGVLDQSLYKVARIELGLTDRSDFVEQPLNAVVQIPECSPQAVSPVTPIGQIFDEHAGALLILGAPGTGKTTLLLELARDLLDRAERDESEPIPVVFNLSSWAARRQRLSEWLIAELNERSSVPKRVARQWVEAEQILPLLDGLDEVVADQREACVDAINGFRREHGLLHIAVCSRIADYQALGTKLRLRSAIEVQPLTKARVEEYLERVGEPLHGLCTAVQDDTAFWELLETPLMLWVAMLAYRDEPHVSTQDKSLEQRRHYLFARFVEAMFQRRVAERRYSVEQTKSWLSYLARTLATKNQTVFYLENLDFDWVPTNIYRWLARGELVVVTGLVFGLIFGLIDSPSDGLTSGLTFGVILGLIGNLIKLRPVEKARLRSGLSSRLATSLRQGLRVGLIFGLIFGVIFVLDGVIRRHFDELSEGLVLGLIVGLIFGLIFGLSFGLINLVTSEAAAETRNRPNQGTRGSLKIAVIFGLIFGLMVGLSVGLIVVPSVGPSVGLSVWLGVGLSVGLILGLLSGGLFSLKHFALRLSLWLSRSAPLRYVTFLNEAKDLLFLRQVGGGFIFTHRLLRDYFASVPESKHEPKQNKTSAASA